MKAIRLTKEISQFVVELHCKRVWKTMASILKVQTVTVSICSQLYIMSYWWCHWNTHHNISQYVVAHTDKLWVHVGQLQSSFLMHLWIFNSGHVGDSLVLRLSWNANMYRAESLVSFICKHDLIKIGPKQKGNVLHVVQPTSIIFNSGETSLTVSLIPRLSPCGLGMRLSHSPFSERIGLACHHIPPG